MAFPDWLKKIDKKVNEFVVDPDIYMPIFLKELGAEKGDQYWNEIAFAVMKLDFSLALRMNQAIAPNRRIVCTVRADDGRKARWNLTMFPKGKKDLNKMGVMQRSREIRGHYKRIRGFMPV
jgi:hypothetical protein